jgi:hypothetical protein
VRARQRRADEHRRLGDLLLEEVAHELHVERGRVLEARTVAAAESPAGRSSTPCARRRGRRPRGATRSSTPRRGWRARAAWPGRGRGASRPPGARATRTTLPRHRSDWGGGDGSCRASRARSSAVPAAATPAAPATAATPAATARPLPSRPSVVALRDSCRAPSRWPFRSSCGMLRSSPPVMPSRC